jgi:uncharacterized protein with ParB-like and HNH nuclease domain
VKLEFYIESIPNLSFNKVRFYTIRKEGCDKSEFKDFLDRMNELSKKDSRVKEDLEEIRSQIKAIGKKFGAEPKRFKKEAAAFALALYYPKRKNKLGIYGLRVYCLILSDEIVILMNGGDKTANKAKDCRNVSMHFHEANKFYKIIADYINDNTITRYGRDLYNEQNEPLFC